MLYSREIQDLVDEFNQFPGIGPKTAQRFVFYLLKKSPDTIERLSRHLINIKNVRSCIICGNFSSQKTCPICQDKRRDNSVLIIVAQPQDLMAIEKIGEYKGIYHVLGGLIDTVQMSGPEQIKAKGLIERLRKSQIKEIIFALSSTIEGEGTTLYLINLIKQDPKLNQRLKLSKIARGLPLGSEIEYADEITLGEALKMRKIL